MKFKFTLCCVLACLCLNYHAFAQINVEDAAKKMGGDTMRWTKGGGFGLDLAGSGIRNPRSGAGIGRIGFGGLITATANRKAAKSYWDNTLTLQLAAQRIGRDINGFQKNLDFTRINSRAGWKIDSVGKLFVALDGLAETQLLKTFTGNYLNDTTTAKVGAIAKLFSPLKIQLSPGLDYRPNAHFSIFYSPASLQMTYVGDDRIANIAILPDGTRLHGNEIGKNNRTELGSRLIVKYENKYLKDRVSVVSVLNLYGNYLADFQNIDVTFWRNTINFAIYKGLTLELVGEMNYDNDIPVSKDINKDGRYEIGAGLPDRWGRGGQYIGGFFLKYNVIL